MKTLILMACLLTISYAGDPAKLKEFYDSYAACIKELNVPDAWSIEVGVCTLQKHKMVDDQGLFIKDKILANLPNIISDDAKLHQAQDVVNSCSDKATQASGSNDDKNVAFVKCGISAVDLVDKQ
ncbi:uncharacterized protein [Anoplolepis gracilipes]|uniref:uncharacterized protein n=1 Tax=Anoplolepis gracilipes TaxID=354296 RepID=UPI003B9DD4D0